MRFHTSLWLTDSVDTTRANVVIRRIEQDLWDTEDSLDEWRNHAHDLEARVQVLLDSENSLVSRINGNLLPRITVLEGHITQLQEVERSLRASNDRMVPEGRRLEQRERDLMAHIDGKLLPHIKKVEGRERDLQAHIDGKLLPRIKALEGRVSELVTRINDDLIPKVTTLKEGRKAMQAEAARAAEREKALEDRNAALAEENERLRADLVAARYGLADTDEAGRVLRDEVDSLERDAHDRQALPS